MPDKQALDRIVAQFFAAFVSSDRGETRLESITRLFLPQAVIVQACGALAIHSLSSFIEPRQKILTDGTLLQFEEHEVSEKTVIFGDIAQRLTVYQKSGVLSGKPFVEKGVKSFQFVRAGPDWKISSLSWYDERPGSASRSTCSERCSRSLIEKPQRPARCPMAIAAS